MNYSQDMRVLSVGWRGEKRRRKERKRKKGKEGWKGEGKEKKSLTTCFYNSIISKHANDSVILEIRATGVLDRGPNSRSDGSFCAQGSTFHPFRSWCVPVFFFQPELLSLWSHRNSWPELPDLGSVGEALRTAEGVDFELRASSSPRKCTSSAND